mgnify:CR=1 FL=1
MVFPRVNLDDRTFQDLVDEAKRLIPDYLPEWTNHNVSDPGVALIELFAWMTELTLFRLNQVPDRVYESFLDLVGIAPYSSSQARGDLTFMFASVPEETVSIPMGTEVASLGDDPIIFLTSEDLEIRQPDLLQVMTVPGGPDEEPDEGRAVDTSEDLFAQTEVLTIFGSEVIQRGDAAYFGFAESLGRSVLRIDVEAEVKGVGIDPNRPEAETAMRAEQGNILIAISPSDQIWMNKNQIQLESVRILMEAAHAENPESSVVIVADELLVKPAVFEVLLCSDFTNISAACPLPPPYVMVAPDELFNEKPS